MDLCSLWLLAVSFALGWLTAALFRSGGTR
jgi:hypothetical protein